MQLLKPKALRELLARKIQVAPIRTRRQPVEEVIDVLGTTPKVYSL
jgi:hypothetical protein